MPHDDLATTADAVVPAGKWAFDAEVTSAFDDMLARSIPQYEAMRAACLDLGSRFVRAEADVVDLGCSRGEALEPFYRRFGAENHYVGVEVSGPMLEAARDRFACPIGRGLVEIRADDLRTTYPPVRATLTLCVLTLQFTPIEYRQRIIRDAFRSTLPGGALVLVEKVLGSSADLDGAMVAMYLDMKRANGYTEDQIARKRLALEGILVPVTARWNEELLRSAGFGQVDCFWRWCNFAGWVAIRDGN